MNKVVEMIKMPLYLLGKFYCINGQCHLSNMLVKSTLEQFS